MVLLFFIQQKVPRGCRSKNVFFRIRNISKRKQASGKKHAEHCLRHLNKTACEIWSVFDKVLFCVKYLTPSFHRTLQLVNGDFCGDLKSCMTRQVECLHATHHHKNEASAHVIDYTREFGNTAKEGLKRTTQWAAHYFTNKKSYYPVPSNSVSFWDIPFLPPLPTVQMDDEDQERMREWARNNGKVYVKGLFDKKPPSTRQALSPLTCTKESNQLGKKYSLQSLLPMISMKPS